MKFKKALEWIKRNVWAVVVALVAALGTGIFWAYHNGKVRSLQVQKAVEKAHSKVAALDAERLALDERKEENLERIKAIEHEKNSIKVELVSLDRDIGEMSDEDIEKAFRDLY